MTIPATKLPIQGDESIMSEKKHGTSETAVQKDLRWGCDYDTADRICNFNRHYAGKLTRPVKTEQPISNARLTHSLL
jgi:hypothetical protein